MHAGFLKSWLESAYRQVQDLSSNGGFASINVTYEDNVHVLPAAVLIFVSKLHIPAYDGFATAGIQCATTLHLTGHQHVLHRHIAIDNEA